jgi:hypothetical protein
MKMKSSDDCQRRADLTQSLYRYGMAGYESSSAAQSGSRSGEKS